jgi:hypothetical protein
MDHFYNVNEQMHTLYECNHFEKRQLPPVLVLTGLSVGSAQLHKTIV